MHNYQNNSTEKFFLLDRFLAFIIDILILYLFYFLFNNFLKLIEINNYINPFYNFLISDLLFKVLLIPGIYFGVSHSKFSQTIGMNFFNLVIKDDNGLNLSFKKAYLRTLLTIFLYILSFLFLYFVSFLTQDISLLVFLNSLLNWFVILNPLFLISVLFIFLNKNKKTLYDYIFKVNYTHNQNVIFTENSLDPGAVEISYVQNSEKPYLVYISSAIDIYTQLLAIFILNLVINNFLYLPEDTFYISKILDLALNFLIFSALVPAFYAHVFLSKTQTIGMKILNLFLTVDHKKRYILTNLILTYLFLVIAEIAIFILL